MLLIWQSVSGGFVRIETTHLVLEVLCRYKRVDELLAILDHGMNLASCATEVWIVVESIPQVVDGLVARLGTFMCIFRTNDRPP